MSYPDRVTIRRLEQALQVQEQVLWALNVISVGYFLADQKSEHTLGGLISNYLTFREHLLSIRSMDEYDYEKYTFVETRSGGASQGMTDVYPMMLGSWCVNSRRVYHVDRDLQALLLNTKLDDLRWEDLVFPFDSFGISLEVPISRGKKEYDFMLVAPISPKMFDVPVVDTHKIFCLAGLESALERWEPWSLRPTMDRRIRRGEVGEVMVQIRDNNILERSSGYIYGSMLHKGSRSVLETLKALEEKQDPDMPDHLMWRLLAGLCVYRRMRHVESYISPWKRIYRTKMRTSSPSIKSIVSDGSEICFVRAHKKLSDMERKLLFGMAFGKLKGYELECHFREGHYRRPPGKGSDPLYPQTVIVDPTIVRADRWPEHGLPIGLEKTLANY